MVTMFLLGILAASLFAQKQSRVQVFAPPIVAYYVQQHVWLLEIVSINTGECGDRGPLWPRDARLGAV